MAGDENTYYSAGNFRVNGLADGGVGGASATSSRWATAPWPPTATATVGRPSWPLEGLADVSGIGDLPEDDPNNDFNDDDGVNCYLAEVARRSATGS